MAARAVIGRLSLGLFVDRFDPRLACAASMTSHYGFSIGNMITFPPLIQREIGASAFAAAMGLGAAISGIFSAFGPGIIGLVRILNGNYTTAFAMCIVRDLMASGIVLWRPGKRTKIPAL